MPENQKAEAKRMEELRDNLQSVEADRKNGFAGITIDELDRLLSEAIDDVC